MVGEDKMTDREVKVGLLGFGTVGTGVVRMIQDHQEELKHQTGCTITIKKILVKDLEKERSLKLPKEMLTTNAEEIIFDEEIDIIIELIGGVDSAREYISQALEQKKHVITANKDLIALHGRELTALAHNNGCDLLYEASVAGGIPILRTLTDSFSADRIRKIMGILNGTTNYMLTRMSQEGLSYEECLAQAQRLGYAEADPTSDVEGLDAARKLTILSRLGFHMETSLDEVQVRGISSVSIEDIEYGKSFGYEMKLLAIADRQDDEIVMSVQPTFVHKSHPLAHVNGVFNAVYVYGDAVGETMFYGPGAGEMPTASAVVGDLVNIVKNSRLRVNGRRMVAPYLPKKLMPKERIFNRYFVRLIVEDKPGVLAQITHSLAELDMSISKINQKTIADNRAEVVLITHEVSLKAFETWLEQLEKSTLKIASYYAVEGEEHNE